MIRLPPVFVTVKVWSKVGPRDQTNCMNGWGIRVMTVEVDPNKIKSHHSQAICKVIGMLGRENYGGIAD